MDGGRGEGGGELSLIHVTVREALRVGQTLIPVTLQRWTGGLIEATSVAFDETGEKELPHEICHFTDDHDMNMCGWVGVRGLSVCVLGEGGACVGEVYLCVCVGREWVAMCLRVRVCVCVRARARTCVSVRRCVCVWVCVPVCICVCVREGC